MALGPKYYPVRPRIKPTRTSSLSGKTHANTRRSGVLDSLDEWNGYRVFKDPGSPTGWIDLKGRPIDAVDTNGYQLRRNLRTGKLVYVIPPPSDGGFSLGKALGFVGGDLLGLGLEFAGLEEVNEVRIGAAVATSAGIFGAGAEGLTGQAAQAAGAGGQMDLSGILSTEGADGLPGWLQGLGGAAESLAGTYERIFGDDEDDTPRSGPPPSALGSPGGIAAGLPSWGPIVLIVVGGLVVFALARGVRGR